MTGIRSYSEDFKQMAVKKLLSTNSKGLSEIAKNIGIPTSTLFGWKKKYAKPQFMKKNDDKNKAIDWTPEQKLQAIIETSNMGENELGQYLRKYGLHSSTLEEWKWCILSGLKPVGRPKKDPEVLELRKKEKTLQKELNRKDKALAEMSARIVLLKKSQEIFGEIEDEE